MADQMAEGAIETATAIVTAIGIEAVTGAGVTIAIVTAIGLTRAIRSRRMTTRLAISLEITARVIRLIRIR